MRQALKSIAMRVPAFRKHMERVAALAADHDRLAWKVEQLTADRDSLAGQAAELTVVAADRDRLAQEVDELNRKFALILAGRPLEDWSELKRRKRRMSEEVRAIAPIACLSHPTEPAKDHLNKSVNEWIAHQVMAEPYWFHKIELVPEIYTPGWSDPEREKLPYYGLPRDLTGMRVLDIGCAEGFFSFEAERRGAREVIGIDSFPESVRRFNIVKAARQSKATAFLMNVYDLEPQRLGTFDLVLFYGVFYHLRHPHYALERIRGVCTGKLLFQTCICEEPAVQGTPWARFYPHGLMSGKNNEMLDPTVFWLFNSACCLAILEHVGFTDLEIISNEPKPFVVKARSPNQAPGIPPDQTEAPWS